MCSEFTPRARIPDTRIPQLMQPWLWCFINRLVSNQENVFPIKTYLTTRQVYSECEVHNCMKIDWRSCGSRCRLKLVHFAWTMGAIIGGPTIREMSLRLTQSAQNKSLIIPITRSTWFNDKSLQTTTEKNWNLNFQTRGCIEIRDLSHYCGGRCSSIFEMSEKLVLFRGLLFLCGLWIEHPSNDFFGATNARMPWTCFWQTLKIWALLKWVY